MKLRIQLTLVLSSLVWLTACPSPKKSTADGVTRAGGQPATDSAADNSQKAGNQNTNSDFDPRKGSESATGQAKPKAEDGKTDTVTTPQKPTTPESTEVLTQRERERRANGVATNHRDKCDELSDIEKRLLAETSLGEAEKTKLVNTILVSLGASKCPQIVSNLQNSYKNDPVADLINYRVKQLGKSDAKSIVALVHEMSEADIPLELNAEDVWKQAKDEIKVVKNEKGTSVEGTITSGNRSVRVISRLPENAQLPQNPRKDDVVKILKDQKQTLSFTGLESKDIPVVMTSNSKETIAKASTKLQEIEKAAEDQKRKAQQTTSTQQRKWAFDTSKSNMMVLQACDNNGFTATTLDKFPEKQPGSEVQITGLKLSEDMGIEGLTEKTQDEIAKEAILPNENQKVADQGFWFFSTKPDNALKFKPSIKIDDSKPETPMVAIEFPVYGYTQKVWDVKTQPAIYYDMDSKYDTTDNTKKMFMFNLDPVSAYWLRARVDRIATCVEKTGISTPGASRDSILAYILYKVRETEMNALIKGLNL